MAAQTSSYKARSQVKHPLPSLDRSVIKRSSLKKKKKSSRPLTDWLRPASSRCGVNGRFLNEEPAAAAGGDRAARVGRPYHDYPNSINKVINPGCTMAPRPRTAIKRHYMAGVTAKEFTHTHTHGTRLERGPCGKRPVCSGLGKSNLEVVLSADVCLTLLTGASLLLQLRKRVNQTTHPQAGPVCHKQNAGQGRDGFIDFHLELLRYLYLLIRSWFRQGAVSEY